MKPNTRISLTVSQIPQVWRHLLLLEPVFPGNPAEGQVFSFSQKVDLEAKSFLPVRWDSYDEPIFQFTKMPKISTGPEFLLVQNSRHKPQC